MMAGDVSPVVMFHINGIPAIVVKAWSLSRRNIVLVLPRFITLPCPPHLVRQLECFSLTDSVAKAEETCDELSDFLEVLVDNMFNPGASIASVICTPTSFRKLIYV